MSEPKTVTVTGERDPRRKSRPAAWSQPGAEADTVPALRGGSSPAGADAVAGASGPCGQAAAAAGRGTAGGSAGPRGVPSPGGERAAARNTVGRT